MVTAQCTGVPSSDGRRGLQAERNNNNNSNSSHGESSLISRVRASRLTRARTRECRPAYTLTTTSSHSPTDLRAGSYAHAPGSGPSIIILYTRVR